MSSNRLINEKSPYLLQHAENPVDWYPWGEEAFGTAKRDDKPIFLSIGYSTCYWCHVMEREVFENAEIAALMNRLFVNIKVDREERPDVDRIYMTALQAMTGSGGWPMSMFLTHDRRPFYGATYIPPATAYGRPGFPEVLERVSEAWNSRREEILTAGGQILAHLQRSTTLIAGSGVPEKEVLAKGVRAFSDMFDEEHGGFGGAPKFPRPAVMNFLFRYAHVTGDDHPSSMALRTLRAMHAGGMYDHIGGGFHRYSTDAEWHLPHFEKMLYDQAQLAVSFLEAFQVSRDRVYARIAGDILRYVEENLLSPEGGFFSAEDAESIVDVGTGRKKEGAFFVWSAEEITRTLPEDHARIFSDAFDVRPDGNVAHDPHDEFKGMNVLRRVRSDAELARDHGRPAEEIEAILQKSRQLLSEVRARRHRPHRDDKVLASWNGMMISAFAKASRVMSNDRFRSIAEKGAAFLLGTLYDSSSGTLFRRYRDGDVRFHGGLEDYAWVIQCLLDLYDATFDPRYLERAQEILDHALRLFGDEDAGGFFDTVEDDALIARLKESYDGAEPSGNAVMVGNLIRFSDLFHDSALRKRAERSLQGFSEILSKAPHAVPQLLVALETYLGRSMQIVFRGDRDDPMLIEMVREVNSRYLPGAVLFHVGPSSGEKVGPRTVQYVSSFPQGGNEPAVFVCEDYACRMPVHDPAGLRALLDVPRES